MFKLCKSRDDNKTCLQQWNGTFFDKTSLKSLGLRIQLGHYEEDPCPLPKTTFNDDFIVIDDHGVHEISLDYCGCTRAKPKHIQLLRRGWYPATTNNPKTAATFRLLERFHVLTFESKTSAYEFYQSLARETNNVATSTLKVSSFKYSLST